MISVIVIDYREEPMDNWMEVQHCFMDVMPPTPLCYIWGVNRAPEGGKVAFCLGGDSFKNLEPARLEDVL